MIFPKFTEHLLGCDAIYMEPFIVFSLFLLYTSFSQICMKILIYECLSGTIIKSSIALPFKSPLNICSMCLLPDTRFYILFCISNLRPPIMTNHFRSGITINHWNHLFGCLNIRFIHAIPSPLHCFQ